jgi:hypothetical protein
MNIVLARLGMAAVIFATGALSGAVVQEWRFNAGERSRLESVIKAVRAEVARLNDIAYEVGQALGREAQGRLEAGRLHQMEIEKWKRKGTVHVQCPNTPEPVAVPESAVSFGGDYLDLWNGSLCLAVTGDERAACAAAGVDGAGAEADSPVTPGRLLGNVGENAIRWGECLDRLAGWQRWARDVGLTGGARE